LSGRRSNRVAGAVTQTRRFPLPANRELIAALMEVCVQAALRVLLEEGCILRAAAEAEVAAKERALVYEAAALRAEANEAAGLLGDAEWVDGAPFWVVEELQQRRTAAITRLEQVRQLLGGFGGAPVAMAVADNEHRVRALAMECLSTRLGSDRGREGMAGRLCKALEGMAGYEKAMRLGVSLSWLKPAAPVSLAKDVMVDKLAKIRQHNRWM
jgi:hypothetical protein